jgi:hypothetical protein
MKMWCKCSRQHGVRQKIEEEREKTQKKEADFRRRLFRMENGLRS